MATHTGDQDCSFCLRVLSTLSQFMGEGSVRFTYLITILALGAARLPAGAQAAEPPFRANGAFFALSVPDVAASARWYREKLGLRVILDPPKANGAKAVILEGGGLLVELIQHDQAPVRHDRARRARIALRAWGREGGAPRR